MKIRCRFKTVDEEAPMATGCLVCSDFSCLFFDAVGCLLKRKQLPTDLLASLLTGSLVGRSTSQEAWKRRNSEVVRLTHNGIDGCN